MANNINNVVIVGNVTSDARNLAGKGIGFSIAVNKSSKDSTGNWVTSANFFNVVAWGDRFNGVQPYLRKGTMVAIQGSLDQSKYTDKDGVARQNIQIVAFNIQLCGSRPQGDNNQNTQHNNDSNDNRDVPF